MRSPDPDIAPDGPRRASFETTRWGLVLAAADGRAGEALGALCAAYWYPLYAFIRRRGHDPDRAADLTQGFFARLLETDALRLVDPARGRFRAFLLAACKHYLANEHDREAALKRGGGRAPLSIDRRDAEGRYLAEPAHDLTPERLFERRWALTLLDQALEELAREFRQAGKGGLYERLKFLLTGADGAAAYAEVGAALGMSEAAVKKAAQRLRERYRAILRERVGATVGSPAEVEDEVRTLFAILAT